MAAPALIAPAKRQDVVVLDNGRHQTVTMIRKTDGERVTVNFTEEDMAGYKALGFVAISPEQVAQEEAAAIKAAKLAAEAAAAKAAQDKIDAEDWEAVKSMLLSQFRADRAAKAAAAAKLNANAGK